MHLVIHKCDSPREKGPYGFFRTDLHFTLTQILVNIFRSGYFSNKEDTYIYENLRESEIKVSPKKPVRALFSWTVTNVHDCHEVAKKNFTNFFSVMFLNCPCQLM